MKQYLGYALLGGALLLLGGCAAQREPEPAPEPISAPAMDRGMSASARLDQLGQSVQTLQGIVGKLPGRSDQAHRALVQQGLEELAQVLSLLSGPDAVGALRQQEAIIRQASQRLSSGSRQMHIEPTVDSALRSAARALRLLNADQFADQAIEQRMDAIDARMKELDVVHGPIHQLVVAQAFNQIVEVTRTMQTTLQQRLETREEPPTDAAPGDDTSAADEQ